MEEFRSGWQALAALDVGDEAALREWQGRAEGGAVAGLTVGRGPELLRAVDEALAVREWRRRLRCCLPTDAALC